MNVSKIKNSEDKININFDLVETKTGQMSIGAAQSNSTGTSFNFNIMEKNFLGTGNTLNVDFTTSSAVTEASFYFEDPYFTDDKRSISYGMFNKSLDGSELAANNYTVDETGFIVGYGIPLTKDTRINSNIRLSEKNIKCSATFTDEPVQCGIFNAEKQTEAKASLNWHGTTLNHAHYPTEGAMNALSFDIALPMGDIRYYKLSASHKNYQDIGKDLTLKMNANIKTLQGYNGKDAPFYERYYGGGANSIRGFEFNSLGPKYDNGNAKGGELSVLAGASIITPVKFIKDSKNMRMSAFIDTGGIYDENSNFNFNDLRMSTGLAFSWLTPIGPLGIYAAKPIIKNADDETKSFAFTLGSSF